jgi:hypothetical protein
MTIAFNYDNVQTLTNPVLIGNNTQLTGGSVDGLPSITLSGATPVSSILELQSTLAAFLPTRMTSTQRDLLTPADGMLLYNTTLGKTQAREGGSWVTLSNSSGGTFVADAGTAAAPSYTFTGDLDTGMYQVAANTIGFSSVGALQFKVSPTTNAVNFVEVTGAATGQTPILGVSGTDGNVSLDVVLKNTGTLNIKGDDPSNTPGTIRFFSQDNGEYTAITTAEPASNATFKLPPSMPAATDGGLVPLRCDSLGEMTFDPDGAIIHQRTQVTSAAVKTMFTTGAPILAAPPAGKTIMLRSCLLRLKAGTAYANGGTIQLQYGSTGNNGGISAVTANMPANLLYSTAARGGSLLGDFPEQDIASLSGIGIFMSCDTANFITGTGDMYVDTWFSIIPALP